VAAIRHPERAVLLAALPTLLVYFFADSNFLRA